MALPQRHIEKASYTEEEYLTREEASPARSEYVRGEINALPDATVNHSVASLGIGTELHSALRGRNCRVLSCQMKVRTPDGTIRYPDVSVIKGASQYHGEGRVVITNPLLIVEVLSDATESGDRGAKWREYRKLDSLQTYLLVAPDSPRVEQYTRRDDGGWDYHVAEGLEQTLSIPALGVTVALAGVYGQSDLDVPEPSVGETVLSVTPGVVEQFLMGAGEFLPPDRLLNDLSDEQAMTVPPGSLYSIAQIVAHMHCWQERNIGSARGVAAPRPEHLDDTFPTPTPGEWNALRASFLDGLAVCAQAAAENGLNVGGGPEGSTTVGYDLAACPALHSAYHYGQIAMLRQIQGLWPPAGGDDSW